jgi:hypothetical protein
MCHGARCRARGTSLTSDGIRRTRPAFYPARIGHQKFLVETPNIPVIIHAWIAQRVERAKNCIVGGIAKNERQVTSGNTRRQHPLDRGACIAEGTLWIALVIADDGIQFRIADKD